MKKEEHIKDVQGAPPKQQVFGVPDGYFESLPHRLKERMEAEKETRVPVRRLRTRGYLRVAMAAALAGLILLSIPLINRLSAPGPDDSYADLILLDGNNFFGHRSELDLFLAANEEDMDDEEAYVSQAMDYLAMNDVEMDLIFE